MLLRLLLLSLLLVVTSANHCQNRITPEYIDSSLRKSKNGKGKHITDRKVEPSENYAYNKRTNNLFYFDLYYPDYKHYPNKQTDHYLQFFIFNAHLVKFIYSKHGQNGFRNYYYFNNDSLIFKKEDNSLSVDTIEYQKLFNEYKIKGENLGNVKFKKGS